MEDKTLNAVVPFMKVMPREFPVPRRRPKEEYIYEDFEGDDDYGYNNDDNNKERESPKNKGRRRGWTTDETSTDSIVNDSSSSLSYSSSPASSPRSNLSSSTVDDHSIIRQRPSTAPAAATAPIPSIPPTARPHDDIAASISSSSFSASATALPWMHHWLRKKQHPAAGNMMEYIRSALAKGKVLRPHRGLLHHEKQYREKRNKERQAILEYHRQVREQKEQEARYQGMPEKEEEGQKTAKYLAKSSRHVHQKLERDHIKYSRWQEGSKVKIQIVNNHLLDRAHAEMRKAAERKQAKDLEALKLNCQGPDLTQIRQEEVRQTQEILSIMRRSGIIAGVNPSRSRRKKKKEQVIGDEEEEDGIDDVVLVDDGPSRQDGTFLILRPANKSTTAQITSTTATTPASYQRSSISVMNSNKRKTSSSIKPPAAAATATTTTTMIRRSAHRRQSSGALAATTASNYFDADLQRCRNVLSMKCEGPLRDGGLSALGLCLGKGYCGQMHTLDLHGNKIGLVGIEGLISGLIKGGAPKLEKLDLSRNELSGKAIRLLVQAIIKHGILLLLTDLDLKNNYLRDSGAAAIASAFFAEKFNQISRISLQHNQISDQGAHALFLSLTADPSRYCHGLKMISVRHNPLTQQGIKKLQPTPAYLQY